MALLGYILFSHLFPVCCWERCLWLWSWDPLSGGEMPLFLEFTRYHCPLVLHFLAVNVQITNLLRALEVVPVAEDPVSSVLMLARLGPARAAPPVTALLQPCSACLGREGWPPPCL